MFHKSAQEYTGAVKGLVLLAVLLFVLAITATLLDLLTFLVFDLFRAGIFTISLLYFLWHYSVTKGHVPSYERVSEGALICAIIFNPLLEFKLDLAVWLFLETIFLWVFLIFFIRIRFIQKNIRRGNRYWSDVELMG